MTDIFDNDIEERKSRLQKELGEDESIVSIVLKKFGVLTGSELIDLTHVEGSPWDECYKKGQRVTIPDQVTQRYYRRLIESYAR